MPQAYTYTDVYQAPEGLRNLNCVPLALDQINALVARAYELDPQFAVGLGLAKAEFRAQHVILNSQWAIRSAAVTEVS